MKAETSNIVSFQIDPRLALMLEKTASKQDRSKAYILRKALENYLKDQQNLTDDIKTLIEHKRSGSKTTSLEKIIKKYNLKDNNYRIICEIQDKKLLIIVADLEPQNTKRS